MTAQAVRDAQYRASTEKSAVPKVVALPVLREQDFGSFECKPWASKATTQDVYPDATRSDFKPRETAEAMQRRAEDFLDNYLRPLLSVDKVEEKTVAVVSHGLFLSALWKFLIVQMSPDSVSLAPDVGIANGVRPLEHLPGWSNTGYLYLELDFNRRRRRSSAATTESSDLSRRGLRLKGWRMKIITVNGKEHLNSLKRTRGGLGSAAYDSRQKKLESYFKKPKVNESHG